MKVLAKKREIWADNVKVIACLLVLSGHFFMSMPADVMTRNALYEWFIQTIYYFHVPLFFVVSGYLYQRYSRVDSIALWKSNIVKKAIALGVPYFTFSMCTWLLKVIFSGSVNQQAEPLITILFTKPSAPYWYLYALFFIFVVTPTFKNAKTANIVLIISALISVVSTYADTHIYAVNVVLRNEIWFMLGICMAKCNIKECIENSNKSIWLGAILLISFIIISVLVYAMNIDIIGINVYMGMLACIAIIILTVSASKDNSQTPVLAWLSKYTMPIYVMHTICAAMMRSILLKLGIYSFLIHIVVGIGSSIIGPIIVAMIMKKTIILEFFLYPNKFINARNKKVLTDKQNR